MIEIRIPTPDEVFQHQADSFDLQEWVKRNKTLSSDFIRCKID